MKVLHVFPISLCTVCILQGCASWKWYFPFHYAPFVFYRAVPHGSGISHFTMHRLYFTGLRLMKVLHVFPISLCTVCILQGCASWKCYMYFPFHYAPFVFYRAVPHESVTCISHFTMHCLYFAGLRLMEVVFPVSLCTVCFRFCKYWSVVKWFWEEYYASKYRLQLLFVCEYSHWNGIHNHYMYMYVWTNVYMNLVITHCIVENKLSTNVWCYTFSIDF